MNDLGALSVAAQQPFNSAFYTASVTVIPIFFITLAVELREASSPLIGRMVALYRYRKLRRFESLRERMHWILRGLLLLLTALLPAVTVLGWAAEVAGLIALDRRTVSGATQELVLLAVMALPTTTLFWAVALGDRESTPFEEELDQLAQRRDRRIGELGAELRSMEADAASGRPVDSRRVQETQRRLATLTRQDKRLDKSTDRTRRSLRALREREQRRDSASCCPVFAEFYHRSFLDDHLCVKLDLLENGSPVVSTFYARPSLVSSSASIQHVWGLPRLRAYDEQL
jgi:membrane protein implicated in regulation of membrane protease activity